MTCDGCTTSVSNLLKKFKKDTPGVKSYSASLSSSPREEAGLVEIITDDSVDYNTVLAAVKRSGKEVKTGDADGQQMAVTV